MSEMTCANNNLHPTERIIQEYRRVTPPLTPPHVCPDVLHPQGGNPLWEEYCALARRVQALESELAFLRRELADAREARAPVPVESV